MTTPAAVSRLQVGTGVLWNCLRGSTRQRYKNY